MFNHRSIQPTIFDPSVRTTVVNPVLFYSWWLQIFSICFSYVLIPCTHKHSPAWEMQPGCPSRAADTGTSLYQCPILHSWKLLFFLLSLTSASGCFLLTFHGGGPESIRIHFSGFLARCHCDRPTEKSGDDGYSPACWYRFQYELFKGPLQSKKDILFLDHTVEHLIW